MTDSDHEITDLDAFVDKLTAIRREIREEYLKPHSKPWIIGFSGGKDSTLLTHFVIECILSIAPDERHRSVYIVSNDTLVESPIFQGFVDRLLVRMKESIEALGIPVSVVKTSPLIEETFWVIFHRRWPKLRIMMNTLHIYHNSTTFSNIIFTYFSCL